ncbi:hypothetical protein HGRIS_001177 [Hohenbuehelia grisea]|uniref:Uncharacterized protein n=1 Tax=Hohenbuehelia grisea TaxID=104357 RepID=A0ABR3JPJ4_9AGAR
MAGMLIHQSRSFASHAAQADLYTRLAESLESHIQSIRRQADIYYDEAQVYFAEGSMARSEEIKLARMAESIRRLMPGRFDVMTFGEYSLIRLQNGSSVAPLAVGGMNEGLRKLPKNGRRLQE